MLYDHCTTIEKCKTKPLRENKKNFLITNPNGKYFEIIRIDGCLIDASSKKCDWLVCIQDSSRQHAVFIELKGTDIEYACEQLIATINSPAVKTITKHYEIFCVIVCSRVPKGGPKTQALKKAFYKKTKTLLQIYTIETECCL